MIKIVNGWNINVKGFSVVGKPKKPTKTDEKI